MYFLQVVLLKLCMPCNYRRFILMYLINLRFILIVASLKTRFRAQTQILDTGLAPDPNSGLESMAKNPIWETQLGNRYLTSHLEISTVIFDTLLCRERKLAQFYHSRYSKGNSL